MKDFIGIRMCLLFNPFRVMKLSLPFFPVLCTGLFIFIPFGDVLRVTKSYREYFLTAINSSTNNCSFDYFQRIKIGISLQRQRKNRIPPKKTFFFHRFFLLLGKKSVRKISIRHQTPKAMKTTSSHSPIFSLLFSFFLLTSTILAAATLPDTTRFTAVRGVVLNSETRQPVVFASVFIEGTNMGTVSNSNGRFLIKIPLKYRNKKLGFSSIGFKTQFIAVSDLNKVSNKIYLKPAVIPIQEVVIRHLDPEHLLSAAVEKIPKNYMDHPVMMTGFYRESIRKNKKYLSVAEAVLNIYKSSYGRNVLSGDRVSIYKGRKAQYAKRKDTLAVKFQGGPLSLSYLDIVRNPGDILSKDMYNYYQYKIDGVIMLDKRETYVISFDQKDTVQLPLFKGKIYLDAQSLAIAGMEVEISPKQLQKALRYIVKKKPSGLKIKLLGVHILVKYRKIGEKWFLNYLREETDLQFKWEKKLFRSDYTITAETAVTDIDTQHVVKPKYSERFRPNDVFSEKVSSFTDPEFWGSNNVIEPEVSIQTAIKKISRKLKRKQ